MSHAKPAYLTARICAVFTILLLVQLGCAVGAPAPTATPAATATAVPTSTPTATLTSTPTLTPTPTLTSTPTLTRTATPNRTATNEAKISATVQAQLALVSPVLEKYKVETGAGSLVYYAAEPYSVTVDQYNTFVYNWVDDNDYADFIYHSDVAWESTGGLAGCGVIFRSDGDIDGGEYYMFEIMRLQNAPAWEILYSNNSNWKSLGWNYANAIEDTLGGTNSVTVIAKGANMQLFVNDKKMTEVDYNKLSKGQIAELVWQDSGKTACNFTNSWVWTLK